MKLIFSGILGFLLFQLSATQAQDYALSPAEFEKQISIKDVQLLDVRTTGEYHDSHLAHALWADWNKPEEFRYRVQYLDKKRPVYVYCLSGGRSAAAASWMRENGFAAVYELKGGIKGWKAASLPTEGVSAVRQMTLQEFQAQIGGAKQVLVDFGAEWCPPCKKMQPVLDQLKKERGGSLQVITIDGGTQTDIMKEIGVEAIPTFILYRNGKESWRKQGIASIEEFSAAIDKR
jgi:thioredoxin